MTLSSDQASDEHRQMYVMPICAAIALAALVLDWRLRHYNFSILYVIPLLLCAKLNRRQLLVGFALLLIGLTYLGHILKKYHEGQQLGLTHITNRHLVALTVLVTTAVLYSWQGITQQLRRGRNVPYLQSSNLTMFEEMEESLARLVVLVLCIIMIAALLLFDMTTPAEINFPILFAIPLVLAAWARNLKLLWALVPVLTACAWVGFCFGPGLSEDAIARGITVHTLVFNRSLANLVVIAIAGILHVAIYRWRNWIGLAKTHSASHNTGAPS